MKRLAFMLIVVCMGAAVGCSHFPPGYTPIRNGLRLSERRIEFPTDTNVLRLAVREGAWESHLWLRDVEVRRGSLTFQGQDGAVSFASSNSLVLSRPGQPDKVFPMGHQSLCFVLLPEGTVDTQQMIVFQREVAGEFRDNWYRQEGTNIWTYSPRLTASRTNGFWLVEIPFSRSPDFDGRPGTLTVAPNWYNGPR